MFLSTIKIHTHLGENHTSILVKCDITCNFFCPQSSKHIIKESGPRPDSFLFFMDRLLLNGIAVWKISISVFPYCWFIYFFLQYLAFNRY